MYITQPPVKAVIFVCGEAMRLVNNVKGIRMRDLLAVAAKACILDIAMDNSRRRKVCVMDNSRRKILRMDSLDREPDEVEMWKKMIRAPLWLKFHGLNDKVRGKGVLVCDDEDFRLLPELDNDAFSDQ